MFLLQASTTALFDLAALKLIAPELILTVCACVARVMEVVLPYRLSRWTGYFTLVGLALAAASVLVLGWPFLSGAGTSPLVGFYGTLKIDGFAVVFSPSSSSLRKASMPKPSSLAVEASLTMSLRTRRIFL